MTSDIMPNDKKLVTLVQDLRIPRGDSDDFGIHLDTLGNYCVFDSSGQPIRFADLFCHTTSIIIFSRHPQCFTSKEFLEDLKLVTDKQLNKFGIRMTIVFPVTHNILDIARQEFNLCCQVVCDPSRDLYNELGFTRHSNTSLATVASSSHVKSSFAFGLVRTGIRALRYQDTMADMYQNGGCLLAGPGNRLLHCHRDRHLFDQMPINRMLQLMGADCLSFPKDQRVIHV